MPRPDPSSGEPFIITYFDGNNGDTILSSVNCDSGTSVRIYNANDLHISKDGYYLSGWVDSLSGAVIEPDTTITVTSDMNLFTIWEAEAIPFISVRRLQQFWNGLKTVLAGKQDTLTVGNGINITSNVIKNTQGIEYIEGTQTAATNVWTGVSKDSALFTGKIIAYHLPYAGTSTAATLTLTMADGTETDAIELRRTVTSTVTTHFAAGNVIIMIYDGEFWKVSAYYDANTNYVPTGYCTTGASTANKAVTNNYGYRDDPTYFPCVFRYANTAANATLSISSYATAAAPIYVNGARTSSSNTFGRGVIMFLYYNSAYYCYNDGRFPIVVNGTVTSVQDQLALCAKSSDLATVATSGSYNDLSNKPTIPDISGKQDTLVSGTNIKTINNTSLLGSGNITISGGSSLPEVTASDNGAFLRVVDGAWAKATIDSANGVSF